MNTHKLIFLLTGLLLTFYSCGGERTPTENDLKYEIVQYEKQSSGCDSLREDNCAKIKIEFPQITEFGNGTVKNKINKSIENLFSSNDGSTTGADHNYCMIFAEMAFQNH